MKALIVTVAACVVFNASSATAQEKHVLLNHKAWEVTVNETNDGNLYCRAATENRDGEVLAISANHEKLFIWMFLDAGYWRGNFEDDAVLHIDYKQWSFQHSYFETDQDNGWNSIRFQPVGDGFGNLLEDIYNGSAISLKDANGNKTLSSWSLAGSAAALLKFGECTDRLESRRGTGYGINSGYGR